MSIENKEHDWMCSSNADIREPVKVGFSSYAPYPGPRMLPGNPTVSSVRGLSSCCHAESSRDEAGGTSTQCP